ncbi:hypothetical protein HanXRQr2_Chr13g0613851 [Helianthus annuus]|uniref:Uncharacterized protein n=1 Tax=Helianthus annuus TaxID=4232 RepID=A0A9K3EMY6_HELAN|nr:hypothetical protein HanXRQr2_Chr13g0613851 [Helianthus annuus]KAJ0851331.1 hypothetical protein HanPSC8_Chr13g0590981 [Helianthus annuus]
MRHRHAPPLTPLVLMLTPVDGLRRLRADDWKHDVERRITEETGADSTETAWMRRLPSEEEAAVVADDKSRSISSSKRLIHWAVYRDNTKTYMSRYIYTYKRCVCIGGERKRNKEGGDMCNHEMCQGWLYWHNDDDGIELWLLLQLLHGRERERVERGERK